MTRRFTTETLAWIGFALAAVVSSILLLTTLHELDTYHTNRSDNQLSHIGPTTSNGVPSSVVSSVVLMNVEETVHFNRSMPSGQKEWPYTRPPGSGNLRLGPLKQVYAASVFHQLHCIEIFSNAITGNKKERRGHLQHCLNYLREMALCRPDLTLEQGDFTQRDFSRERAGATHICRNWDDEYQSATSNWLEWVKSKEAGLGRG
ncbi:hypothetical protein HGRIS_006066 [Hohenbuehelia grisea]|uniref:Oxidase ustYa n=1 Tax=Hohenbuehelia grisea TaxID=104357 RepID=A0ABR3JYP4_9AGAR